LDHIVADIGRELEKHQTQREQKRLPTQKGRSIWRIMHFSYFTDVRLIG